MKFPTFIINSAVIPKTFSNKICYKCYKQLLKIKAIPWYMQWLTTKKGKKYSKQENV